MSGARRSLRINPSARLQDAQDAAQEVAAAAQELENLTVEELALRLEEIREFKLVM